MITPPKSAAPTCKCGGSTHYIGIQRFAVLGYQRPLFDCNQCGTTPTGDKEALTEPETAQEGGNSWQ